ncbi:MAG: hypothetical protein MR663_03885 [Lachnospiraceae bacterium]|nr:hypothetical protein [Lachnospiraceae bacterium]MDD7668078.1 hypothetical protein [Lachnospiraceae bacterium]MDY2620143.1 hypothetical protein [Agathobacter sp.]
MAGLLLELRRQIAKNHRKGIYGNASVQRRETPNMKDSVPKRNSMADMHQGKMSEKVLQQKEQGVDVKKPMETVLPEMQEESIDHIQERTVEVVSKEDFLLNQIDEFRERAKQLQSLLDTKENEAQELQTLVDERQEKAEALGEILKERQSKADGFTAEVEKQIDAMIAKVADKMDEIESAMKEDVADGKKFNEEKAKELKDSLGQIEEQLTTIKSELSEKVHTENVKCYRNIQDLFRSMEEKVDHLTMIEDKQRTIGVWTIVTAVLGIVNLIALTALMLINLGVFA